MTYALFNLTERTQLSIRGTTRTHPDSEFVFGIFMDNDCPEDDFAYDDMEWSRAVEMARWILKEDEWIRKVKQ